MMFWEIIATVLSGFLLAGLVLPWRLVFKKTPKWSVPAAAGLGMIGFQVFSEYTWADDTIAKLPANTAVIAKIEKSTWFRPWSYIKPQVFQFVALDKGSIHSQTPQTSTKTATLYFFERRVSAQPLAITIDCQNPKLMFDPVTNQAITKEVCS